LNYATKSANQFFTLKIPVSGASDIDIYDVNGRCVQRIKPVGRQAVWNVFNAAGRSVSSGSYFAKIKEGKASRIGPLSVVR
jgi:hypothetical protein